VLAVLVIFVNEYYFILFTHTCYIHMVTSLPFVVLTKLFGRTKEILSQVVYEDEKVKYYLCYQDKVPFFF
jgi:hypothetical protein